MRAIWKGFISFGLVNIPVRLYSATASQEINFDMLHKSDLSPIRYAKVCKDESKEVPYNEIVKGYQYAEDNYVVITEEDLKAANPKLSKTINVIDFALEIEIDAKYFEKPYYLEPEKGSEKSYILLREALKQSKKVAITKFMIRNREHLGILKIEGDLIILNQMRFATEIRDSQEINVPNTQYNKQELEMALNLIDQLTKKFIPENYQDTYINELKKVIDDKISGKIPSVKGKAPETTPVPDLLEMLKKSLEQSQEKVGAVYQESYKSEKKKK